MIINIYKLINPSTNEVIYVGQTRFILEKRLNMHYWKLNEANGGIGGYTVINKSDSEKKEIGYKISFKNKGRKKPEGFAEHLSAIRKGKNNPMAKKLMYKVGCYKGFDLIKVFEYAYEIDNFIGKKVLGVILKKFLIKNLIIFLMVIIGNILKNSLRYSQVHNESCDVTQGSTYDVVFVDMNDIVFDKRGRIYPDMNDMLRRLYVACSRAHNQLIISYGN